MGRAFVDSNGFRRLAARWYNTVRFETKSGQTGGRNIPIQAPRTRWMRSYFAAGNAFQPPQNCLNGEFVLHGVVLDGDHLYFPAESAYVNNVTVFPSALW